MPRRRVRTKICGITRAADAAVAVAAGADALGFVFHQDSPRFVAPSLARELIAPLPPFPSRVALFVNPARDFVDAVLAAAPLDLLQFHGDEPPDFCAGFQRPYIKAVRMRDGVDLQATCRRYAAAAALLLDGCSETAWGGAGVSFDWDKVPDNLSRPIILAGGLTADNVRDAIARVRPYAVDVSSGVELEPGRKDKDKIAAFIREASRA